MLVQENKINLDDHVKQMYSFFQKKGIRDEHIIQDLVSKTAERILNTDSYDPSKSAPTTRVNQIMESVLSNYFKSASRSQDALDMSSVPIEYITNKVDDRRSPIEDLMQCISDSRDLSRDQRVILTLRWNDGYTMKEIAARMGMSHEAVRQAHSRAISTLRKEYKDAE